jgi:hypothetical protein
MLEEMPASIELLRIVLGLIGIGCACMAARPVVRARKGLQKQSYATGWIVRSGLCLAGTMFRHPVDAIDIAVWLLMAAAAAAAWWAASHSKPPEDPATRIFPGEE